MASSSPPASGMNSGIRSTSEISHARANHSHALLLRGRGDRGAAFIFWPITEPLTQLEVFAREVVPAVRGRVAERRGARSGGPHQGLSVRGVGGQLVQTCDVTANMDTIGVGAVGNDASGDLDGRFDDLGLEVTGPPPTCSLASG